MSYHGLTCEPMWAHVDSELGSRRGAKTTFDTPVSWRAFRPINGITSPNDADPPQPSESGRSASNTGDSNTGATPTKVNGPKGQDGRPQHRRLQHRSYSNTQISHSTDDVGPVPHGERGEISELRLCHKSFKNCTPLGNRRRVAICNR